MDPDDWALDGADYVHGVDVCMDACNYLVESTWDDIYGREPWAKSMQEEGWNVDHEWESAMEADRLYQLDVASNRRFDTVAHEVCEVLQEGGAPPVLLASSVASPRAAAYSRWRLVWLPSSRGSSNATRRSPFWWTRRGRLLTLGR